MQDELMQSSSKEALQQNIKTEIESGKDPKQAAAIAYSVQKANDANTAELLYCVIEFTESDYYGLTSRVGKQITIDAAETLIKGADTAHRAKNKVGYDKTYLDLYVRYNGHKYKVHLLRFDVGDGVNYMNVKEQANNVLKRIPELINDNLYRNNVKQLDSDIKPGLYKHKNGKVYKSNEIKAQYEIDKPNMDLTSWVDANYTKINDYLESKYTVQKLKDFPLESRNFMNKQDNKESGYLMLLSQAQDMYNECEPNLKQTVKIQVNKVLQDICTQFNLKQCRQIKDNALCDGYTGEIRNIGGKQFKGADGKVYEMPNYTYAIYCPQHNGYYAFKNQNNMPYAPAGGKSALQSILSAGGFLSLNTMTFVKPIRDASTVLKEYSKFENSQLHTGRVIKHNNGYTFVASNPKEDKDSNSLQQLEEYITSKGYKPVY
jgi:hypothetical protein